MAYDLPRRDSDASLHVNIIPNKSTGIQYLHGFLRNKLNEWYILLFLSSAVTDLAGVPPRCALTGAYLVYSAKYGLGLKSYRLQGKGDIGTYDHADHAVDWRSEDSMVSETEISE